MHTLGFDSTWERVASVRSSNSGHPTLSESSTYDPQIPIFLLLLFFKYNALLPIAGAISRSFVKRFLTVTSPVVIGVADTVQRLLVTQKGVTSHHERVQIGFLYLRVDFSCKVLFALQVRLSEAV